VSEIDQQFIEYVVKSLVGKPDAVHIDRRIDEKGVLLELTVDPEDLGRVIGKRGATAQSLRTLLRALGTKNEARYNLKIIDNGPLDKGHGEDKAPPAVGGPSDTPSDAPVDDVTVNDSDDDAAAATPDEESTSEQPEEPAAPEAPEHTPDEAPAAPTEEERASDRLAQTRQELADLDDLDL
jgi:uncharacterized protein